MYVRRLEQIIRENDDGNVGCAFILIHEDGLEKEIYVNDIRKKGVHESSHFDLDDWEDGHISEMHVMPTGSMKYLRLGIPGRNLSKKLEPLCGKTSKILVYRNDTGEFYDFTLRELINSYRSFAVPADVTDTAELEEFFSDNTYLIKPDRDVLQIFRNKMKETMEEDGRVVEIYLVGTSSGRGAPKSLLLEKHLGLPYFDIDMVVLVKGGWGQGHVDLLEKAFRESMIEAGFGDTGFLAEDLVPYKVLRENIEEDPAVVRKQFSVDGMDVESVVVEQRRKDFPSSWDITLGETLEESMVGYTLTDNRYVRIL